jgi:hypothetical protein
VAVPYDLEVKRLVLDGQCVAFVGAGLSMPPALLWVPTVEQIANHCGVPFDTTGTGEEVAARCLDVIDTCLEKDEAIYIQALRKQWPQHTSTTRTAMPYVLRLPFQAILTTNFDPWIRQLVSLDTKDATNSRRRICWRQSSLPTWRFAACEAASPTL